MHDISIWSRIRIKSKAKKTSIRD